MRISRILLSCFGLAVGMTQPSCGPTSPPCIARAPTVTLSGPSILHGGQPASTYRADFTVNWAGSCLGETSLPTVSLVEEPQGTNTGGLFSWENVVIMNPQSTSTASFHLFCPGNSVVGDDGPSYPCNQPDTCDPNGPCSCFREDGRANNPDSNLGGTDVFGQPLAAHVHAEVAFPGGGTTLSNTISVNCHRP